METNHPIWRSGDVTVRLNGPEARRAGWYSVIGPRDAAAKRASFLKAFRTADEAIAWGSKLPAAEAREKVSTGSVEAVRMSTGSVEAVPVSGSRVVQIGDRRAMKTSSGRRRKRSLTLVEQQRKFPWVTTRFQCVRANPTAQVWLCTKYPNEVRVGRKAQNGDRRQSQVPHEKGQFAVTVVEVFGHTATADALRHKTGEIKVFETIREAEWTAENLYEEMDEEERLLWEPGDKLVFSTLNIDVIYDPVNNRHDRPFSLWIPFYGKPIYANRTKITIQFDRSIDELRTAGMSEQMLLEVEAYRRQQRYLSRAPAFTDELLMFPSMEGAITAALRIEREDFHGRFLGFAGQGVPSQ